MGKTCDVLSIKRRNGDGTKVVPCGRPSSPPASPVAFSEQMPSAFRSVLGVFYPDYCLRSFDALSSQHSSTSLSWTLLLTRMCPPSIPTLLASGRAFSAVALYGCRGNVFALLGLHDHQLVLLAGLHCQYRRGLPSIDVMKRHRFMRELYSQHAE